jgi:NAD(P)-dependent dehydrogenase (short-subunit alcohol dehydrogenase family)
MTTAGGLDGQAFLVTGGGSGIGFACAARLAADGATVTICGRDESKLMAAVDRADGRLRHVVADVTVEDDVRRACESAAEPTGHLDGCVANAGGGGSLAPLHQQSVEDFRRVLDLNVVGTFLTLKHAVGLMLPAGRGSPSACLRSRAT